MKLSVVIPLLNEEENVDELNERLNNSLAYVSDKFEIIYVDDGSQDATHSELEKIAEENSKVKYLILSRNFGHQVAVVAGLDYTEGDCTIILDGDLQHPPELIPKLFAEYQKGYKVVYGKKRSREGDSIFKKWTASLFYRLMTRITSINIPMDVGDFRLIDRQVVEQLRQMPERNLFLRGQIAWLGFEQREVLFDQEKRKGGKSGYSVHKMIALALDGITSFSTFPLKLVSAFGFTVSFIAFLIILYALFAKFILERVITGWTSLIISTMFIGGIQLLALGVIGEYISRINDNLRKRPLYIVEKRKV